MDHPVFLLAYENEEECIAAAERLRALGGRARNLLAECVEHQGLTRTKRSKISDDLESAGFVFIKDSDDLYMQDIRISPSLAGEEALEMLEKIEENSPKKRVQK
jgi:DNA-binding ferritin-like protein